MLKLATRRGKLYYLRYLLAYPLAVWKILGIIRGERINIVHTNTLHNLHGFPAARPARRPHAWHVREIVLRSKFFRRLELFLARRFADRVIAMSEAIAEMFSDGAARRPSHLRVIRRLSALGGPVPGASPRSALRGGIPDVVDDGRTGLLVTGDAAAVAAAVRRLLHDGSLSGRLASAGVAEVRRRFDACEVTRRIESIYRELLREG